MSTYIGDDALAEARASVEPVIVLELVDFDALSFARRWRADVCHNRRRRVYTLRLGQLPSGARARGRDRLRSGVRGIGNGVDSGRGWDDGGVAAE